ncbi:hypothetical protein M5689_010816 [Euphorbia peplus]|nr:hypothetical protein M5689_010816 [Euphorbia peplus]
MATVRQLWVVVFFVLLFTAACSARNTIFISGEGDDEMRGLGGGRSLIETVSDYNDPTANRGHDPPSSTKNKGSKP